MAESHNFRTALNGFKREDVVRYIEYLNSKHNTLVNQLRTENQALQDELDALRQPEPVQEPPLGLARELMFFFQASVSVLLVTFTVP